MSKMSVSMVINILYLILLLFGQMCFQKN